MEIIYINDGAYVLTLRLIVTLPRVLIYLGISIWDTYPPQGYTYPPQGYIYRHQGYTYPPQRYTYPPQGYTYPPQGY